jgi:hypothetical protein
MEEIMDINEFLKKIYYALNIDAATDGAALDEAWKLVNEKLSLLNEQLAHEAVVAALQAQKIREDEVEWAHNFAECSLDAFRAFAAKRAVQVPIHRSLTSAVGRPPMSDLERDICRQVGVSEATFLKYNIEEKGAGRADQIQEEMNRKLGVSPELYAKYGVPR